MVSGDVAVAALIVYALIEAPIGALLWDFGQDAHGDVSIRALPDCFAFDRGGLGGRRFGGSGLGARKGFGA